MILKTCFLLVLSVAWEVSGASFSKVYVQTGPEVATPVDYSQYGSQIYSYASPQLEHLNAAPVGYEYPVSSSYNNYGVRCLPSNCYYPGQTIASVAAIAPSANVVAYKSPVSNVPVAYSAATNPSGYEYSYVIVDQRSGEHQSHSELSDGGLVRGEYSFLQPDGIVREVQYIADDEQGFNAIVKNFQPVTTTQNEHHEYHIEHHSDHEHPVHVDPEARHKHHDEPAEHEHHEQHEARHGHHDEPAEHKHHEEHEARHGHHDHPTEHEHHEDHEAQHGHHNEPAEHEGHDEHHDHEARNGGHKDPDSEEGHHHEEHSEHSESHHHTHEPEDHETHHIVKSEESDEENYESDKHPAHGDITHENLREGSLAEGHHPDDVQHESHHEHHELQTFPEHGNVYVSYKDLIKCMQAAMNKVNALPAIPRPASPLTYLVFNKPC